MSRPLLVVVGDTMRRYSYSAAAVDRAAHSYSWRRVATQMSALYANVAGLNRAAAESDETRDDTHEAVA